MPAARRPKSGQDATESAAGVDTDQMAKVEHISVKLGRVAFMLPVARPVGFAAGAASSGRSDFFTAQSAAGSRPPPAASDGGRSGPDGEQQHCRWLGYDTYLDVIEPPGGRQRGLRRIDSVSVDPQFGSG